MFGSLNRRQASTPCACIASCSRASRPARSPARSIGLVPGSPVGRSLTTGPALVVGEGQHAGPRGGVEPEPGQTAHVETFLPESVVCRKAGVPRDLQIRQEHRVADGRTLGGADDDVVGPPSQDIGAVSLEVPRDNLPWNLDAGDGASGDVGIIETEHIQEPKVSCIVGVDPAVLSATRSPGGHAEAMCRPTIVPTKAAGSVYLGFTRGSST